MKRILAGTGILLLISVVAVSCGVSNKINGQTPGDVALSWGEAAFNFNKMEQYELLTTEAQEENSHLQVYEDDENTPIGDYDLIQWKVDDSTYYFKLSHISKNPGNEGEIESEWINVVETPDGWRVADLQLDESEVRPYIEGIEPQTLNKEMKRQ